MIAALDALFYGLQPSGTSRALLAATELERSFRSQDRRELSPVLVASALALLANAARVLFESHELAGALWQLQKRIAQVAEGRAGSPLAFRNGDRFQEVALAFTRMMSSLELRAGGRVEEAGRIATALREASAAAGGPDAPSRAVSDLEKLRDDVARP